MALGLSFVERGHPAAAIPHLERALVIRETSEPATETLGEIRFVLARALAENKHTRARAMSLAQQARADYQQSAATQKQVADVDQWIEARHWRVSMQ